MTKSDLTPLLTSVLVPALISLIVSLIVSFFAPRFNLPVWKKQKRKEQQLALADRFSKLSANPYTAGLKYNDFDFERWLKSEELQQEQRSLIFLIPVVFENAQTLKFIHQLVKMKGEENSPTFSSEAMYRLTAEIGARLYAEALDIKLPLENADIAT